MLPKKRTSASIPENATFRREYVLCGKCPKKHGPYWYAYWKEGTRLRKKYVGKHRPPKRPKKRGP